MLVTMAHYALPTGGKPYLAYCYANRTLPFWALSISDTVFCVSRQGGFEGRANLVAILSRVRTAKEWPLGTYMYVCSR